MIKYDEQDSRDRLMEEKREFKKIVVLWVLLSLFIAIPGIVLIEVNAFELENLKENKESLIGACVTIGAVFSGLTCSMIYRYRVKQIIKK